MEKNTIGVPTSHIEDHADKKQIAQDELNRITLSEKLKKFLAAEELYDDTLDLLMEYPDIARSWVAKAFVEILDLKRQISQDEIGIDTVFGRLFAGISGDPHYPGIHICIEQKDGDVYYDKQLALAECTPNMPRDGEHSLRLLVWNSDNEDFTHDFTFVEGTKDSEKAETANKADSGNRNHCDMS